MKKMPIDALLKKLAGNDHDAVLDGHEKRLCREAHELEVVASVLNHDALLEGERALFPIMCELERHATNAGIPILKVELDGYGNSRDVAIRLAEELEEAWAGHGSCVLNAHFRLSSAKEMTPYTLADLAAGTEPDENDQTVAFSFAGPGILAVIESQMPQYVTPDGQCNPSWLLYTLLAGHRKNPLTPTEVRHLMDLSLDPKVVGRNPYGFEWREAANGRRVLDEAAARGLMTW